MNIPEKVKIGGFNYTVVKKSRVDKGNIDVDGEIFYDQGEIALRDDVEQSQEYREMVFLHECLHGIFYSVGLSHDDENLVGTLGKGIHAFIKDNPEVFNQREE